MGSKKKNKCKSEEKEIIDDPRFASTHTDPRFQRVPKRELKVAIDSRFNRMFTDKNFGTSSAPVDKRGRPKKQKTDTSLRHFYRIEEEEKKGAKKNKRKEEVLSSEEEEEEIEKDAKKRKRKEESLISEEEEEEEEEESESDDVDVEGSEEEESSSSSSDEEIDYEDEEDMDNVEGLIAVENVPVVEDATCRLAVVNMDWRHVRAVDLFVVLRSFLPKGGQILSVTVYPSEFGLRRMKEEEVHGPVGLFDDESEKSDEDDDDNNEIDHDKLCAYEKSRLRYYYAVVECDSVATADYLYKSCDGVEFERSSNVLDLRFIPDSMDFKHSPRDVATESYMVPSGYEGLDFHTKVLQHSNIPVSWDEDEPQRVKTLKRKFNAGQLAELELKEFLASNESETDNDEADNNVEDKSDKKHKKRDKYRALIQSGDGSDEDQKEGQDMEVTFNTGLEDLSKCILEKKDKKSETVWEAFLRKRHEKKKARQNQSKYSSEEESSDTDEEGIEQPDDFFIEEPSVKKGNDKDSQGKKNKEEKQLQDTAAKAEAASKAELELLLADDKGGEKGLKGYNMKPKKAKGKKGKDFPYENKIPTSNLDDPRFSALFTSTLFALDPTDPQFKRSAVYARQLAQKQLKRSEQQLVEGENKKQPEKAQLLSDDPAMDNDECMISDGLPEKKEKHELLSLVKSIKMKSKQVRSSSNSKQLKDKKFQPKGMKELEKPELSSLVQSVKKKAEVLKKYRT
ncbi:unnamed protein product [Dovyalis caffra]|uniref:NUC153 domain-containing protein n=1 Tax=Dovyalis caffra TaxID=77055 RepID=A0AAV1SNS4_9ROSI|nr:unnamed protein product [Dovyalis caffra]